MSHRYKICNIENIVDDVISLYGDYSNQTYDDHFEMCKNVESLYCVTRTNKCFKSIILQNQTNKNQKKQLDLLFLSMGYRELDKGSQNVQIFICKIHMY